MTSLAISNDNWPVAGGWV